MCAEVRQRARQRPREIQKRDAHCSTMAQVISRESSGQLH